MLIGGDCRAVRAFTPRSRRNAVAVNARRVGKGPRLAARMTRGDEEQRRRRRGNRRHAAPRGGGRSGNRPAKPSPLSSARRSAMPAGLTRPLIFLGRRIACSAVQPPEGDFRMRFDDAPSATRAAPAAAHRSRGFSEKMPKAWIETPRGGSEVFRATSLALRCASYQRSTVVNASLTAWTAARDGMEKTLDWRCAEQRPHQQLRSAPALAREVGQADRHVDRDHRIVGQAVDESGKAGKDRRPPARRPARSDHGDPAGLAAVDAGDGAAGGVQCAQARLVLPGMHESGAAAPSPSDATGSARRFRAAVRRRRAWPCGPGSRTPTRWSTAAPWPPAGRPAAAPDRPRRSGRRARSAACR